MEEFEKQGGISFFLLYYSSIEQFYYLTYRELRCFFERKVAGGRKSFRFEELNPEYFFKQGKGVLVPYLDMLAKDLEERESQL